MANPAHPVVLTVSPSDPTIFISVSGLLPGTTLVIFSLNRPPPGQAAPVLQRLVSVKADTPLSSGIPLPITKDGQGDPTGFALSGLRFEITVLDDSNVGTTTIGIMRDQDTPAAPPFDRPVVVNVQLTRQAGDSFSIIVDLPVQTGA